MKPEEILERNKQIALMLGLKPLEEPYKGAFVSDADTDNAFRIFFNGLLEDESWYAYPKFHSDWNWLMEAIEFIESLINKLPNGIFVKINTGGCFIHSINDTKNYLAKVYQAGKTKKEAVFIAVSDFAKLYNENKL